MARKPNYQFERRVREQAQAEKRAMRTDAKRQRSEDRKASGQQDGDPAAEQSASVPGTAGGEAGSASGFRDFHVTRDRGRWLVEVDDIRYGPYATAVHAIVAARQLQREAPERPARILLQETQGNWTVKWQSGGIDSDESA